MKLTILSIILFLYSVTTFSEDAIASVRFENNSDNTLSCGKLNYKNQTYEPYIRLVPGQVKVFETPIIASQLRCQISITQNSTTVLTYFNVSQFGVYHFYKDYVPCHKSCSTSNVRYATVIQLPNGDLHYSFKDM